MRVNSERGRNVAVAEHFLRRLHVRSVPHKEARQRVTQVVEPESHRLASRFSGGMGWSNPNRPGGSSLVLLATLVARPDADPATENTAATQFLFP